MVPSRNGEGTELRGHMEIEKELALEKKTYGSHIKILILGGPLSGKSTIFKQMQIIHVDGFKTDQELIQYRGLIDNNIRDIYLQLIAGSRVVGIPLDPIEHITYEIDEIYAPMSDAFSVRTISELLEPLTEFWNSKQIQEIYKRRCEFELLDSTKYYLENLTRIADPTYLPNQEDIVHSRKATMSINSIVFEYTGVSLLMIDVGGQRSERKKWLHLFDDAKVVLFVIDLTGYAKRSEESRMELSRFPKFFRDVGSNAYDMKVALKIFNEVAAASALANAVFLLFFNKVDLFKEILSQVNLQPCFSKFDGENTYEETSKYICEKFIRAASSKKSVFPHFTTATNTENVKLVFRACMESVFKANAKATGLS
nr:heterotrimeric G protein alpha subunit [Caenorhabditis elegans]|eukprot:NP_001020965.1 Guanine nucleotide-binding protein alpha-14 subunit [Caenorhabditis elegans]